MRSLTDLLLQRVFGIIECDPEPSAARRSILLGFGATALIATSSAIAGRLAMKGGRLFQGVTLGPLSLTSTAKTAGASGSTTVVGRYPGSTLTLSDNVGGLYSINSATGVLSWTSGVTSSTDTPVIVETYAGALNSGRSSPVSLMAASANVPDLAPAVGWAGTPTTPLTATAKRSFTGKTPDLTGWKPMAAVCELFKPFLTLTGDTIIGWQVQFGGRAHTFEVICEGTTVSVPVQTWQVRTMADGTGVLQYGYHVKYKTSTHLASWANTKSNIYVRITPSDTTNYGTKIAGPFPINARTTEFDEVRTFSRTTGLGYNHMGQDAIQSCLAYIQANPTKFIKFVCKETNQYRCIPPGSGSMIDPPGFNVFTHDTGVACTIGDGSFGGNLWSSFGHNGICIRGSGMKLDLSLMGFTGLYPSAIQVGNSGGRDRMWFDGCEIFHGNGEGISGTAASRALSGSGANLTFHGSEPNQQWMYSGSSIDHDVAFFDVYAHDMAAYGLSFCRAAINCTVTRVSGSNYENAGHVIGCTDSDIGGIATDTRTYKHAIDMTFTPTGGATAMYIEKTSGNTVAGDLVFYPNNKSISASLSNVTLTVNSVSGVTLAVGDYIGSSSLDGPYEGRVKITAQTSGTAGGAGVYTVSRRGSSDISLRTWYVAQGVGVQIIPIDDATTCAALSSTITSSVPGVVATNDPTQVRLASALAYRGGSNVPSSPIYTMLMPSNSVSLLTIYDVHADSMVSNENACREGWIWSFNKAYNLISTAWISIGEATSIDCYVANCFGTDTTYEWGVANPTYASDLAIQNPGYSGGKWYNVCVDNVTLTGKLGYFIWDGGTQVDANCIIKRVYACNFVWRTGGDPDIVFKDIAMGYEPSGALQKNMSSGNGCKVASTDASPVAESTFIDLTTKVPVLNGFLKMSDGTYAGALVPSSMATTGETGNYGWNLPQA